MNFLSEAIILLISVFLLPTVHFSRVRLFVTKSCEGIIVCLCIRYGFCTIFVTVIVLVYFAMLLPMFTCPCMTVYNQGK